MKINIVSRQSDITLTCNNAFIKDGMLVLEKPVLESGVSSDEVWMPVSNIIIISFLDKTKLPKET